VAPRRELDSRGLDVTRSAPGDALLEEGVAATFLARRDDDARVHTLRPALERRRPALERAHDATLDGEVVLDDVELGDRGRAPGSREDHPIGARHAQLAPTGVDDRGLGRRHAPKFYATEPDASLLAIPSSPGLELDLLVWSRRNSSSRAPATMGGAHRRSTMAPQRTEASDTTPFGNALTRGHGRGQEKASDSLERHLEQLRVEARYHRERRDLYQAKVYGPRPASLARLEELRQTCRLAESRIRRLEQEGKSR
jgi:hypothetical protein